MIIDLNNETDQLLDTHFNELKKLILFALNEEKLPPHTEVSVSFVTDEQIKQLNSEYRKIDEPTDVLSFPLEQSLKDRKDNDEISHPLLLGDIIVSIDRAIEQANVYNHSFKRELSFLVIHGLLHLLGYNHDNEKDEEIMFMRQEQILGAFNIERE